MITTAEAKLKFQQFIDGIPECIATAKKLLGKETLTYEVEEIEAFQTIYERHFKTPEQLGLEKSYFERVFESYVGTAYLWHFGGKWVVDLNKKYTSFGRFYIDESCGMGPDSVSTSIEDWRTTIEDMDGNRKAAEIIGNMLYFHSVSQEYVLVPVRTIN
jgi:hypothetical protein